MLYWILRAQIVRLVLGYGAFDWEFTRFTVSTLAFFTFGMLAQSVIHLLARSFYALHDTKTPLLVSLGVVLVNAGLAWELSRYWGVIGLAGAISISATLNAVVLFGFLAKRLGGMPWSEIFGYLTKVIVASLGMGGVAYMMLRVVDLIVVTHTFVGILTQTLITVLVAIFAYLAMAKLLALPEMQMIVGPIKRMVRK